jgi:DNA-directed RNA polymerase specialized sigma24 family protein
MTPFSRAWLRLYRADTSSTENLGGWLTTVVARVCLNMLRSRAARRAVAFKLWAHEQPDPAEHVAGEPVQQSSEECRSAWQTALFRPAAVAGGS